MEDTKKENPLKKQWSEGFMDGAISAVMPQLEPIVNKFLLPGVEKLKEYLGDDEKMICIRNTSEGAFVIIMDFDKIDIKDNGGIIKVYDVDDFAKKAINGELEEFLD